VSQDRKIEFLKTVSVILKAKNIIRSRGNWYTVCLFFQT